MKIHILEQPYTEPLKKSDPILLGCWLFSIVALTLSYFHEFFWKIKPCYFCEIQRIPFFLMIFIIPLRHTISRKEWIKIVTFICLLASTILATTHTLMQLGWLSDTCITPTIDSMESFQKALESQVPCSKSTWTFFGIPISVYNAAISFSLSCLVLANLIIKWNCKSN